MQPVRMKYKDYVLNLIDTPTILILVMKFPELSRRWRRRFIGGCHSRRAGSDHRQCGNSQSPELKVIPVINKIDLPIARVEETKKKSWKLSAARKAKF